MLFYLLLLPLVVLSNQFFCHEGITYTQRELPRSVACPTNACVWMHGDGATRNVYYCAYHSECRNVDKCQDNPPPRSLVKFDRCCCFTSNCNRFYSLGKRAAGFGNYTIV